jgi:glycosyltransferase involved in cell wall biosynthesis
MWIPPQDSLAYRDMYASADVFVLPTHAEGFGRPIIEAMSMGLPAIATAW